jgi:hypothetical protein
MNIASKRGMGRMSSDAREFQIGTPDRPLSKIRGHLRDAAIEIHSSLSMVNAVISATLAGESQPILTGYMDGSGKTLIYRYLNSGSGIEFENWVDAYRQPNRSLPEGNWNIRRFTYAAPPSGIVGDAVLTVLPHNLPVVDFALESCAQRKHYGAYIVDAFPIRTAEAPGWTANFVIRDVQARTLGPIGIHAYYEESDSAVGTALAHAETMIDGGIALPEVSS